MKGFIVIEGKIIATRIIRAITQSWDGIVIETDDEYIKIRPDNGDVSGLMDSIISTFNYRDE